jgi:hypothetical protein
MFHEEFTLQVGMALMAAPRAKMKVLYVQFPESIAPLVKIITGRAGDVLQRRG